jgi:peptidoglycan-associated lipoprotein
MRRSRLLTRSITTAFAGALLAALATGCSSPAKVVKPETDVRDAAPMAATTPPVAAPAAVPEAPPPPACSLARVHFAFDSSLLDAAARGELKGVAACLAQRHPAHVVIEGHTDERGTTAYNLALGGRRADAVRAYLRDLGVAAGLETISFGKELPLVNGENEEAWGQNRRAELRLPGDKRSDGVRVTGG